MWPRRKNTRGGDDEEDEDAESGGTGKSPGKRRASSVGRSVSQNRSPSQKRGGSNAQEERRAAMKDISNDGSLEARMAVEGRKLKAAMDDEPLVASASSTTARPAPEAGFKRSKMARNMNSTESLRMPGRFD
jgi:hypothetical protein